LAPDVLICGTSIRLLALETTKSKWTAMLIGARPGRYLIVEMPRVAGAPMKLDEGTHWSANFISKGAVYSFNTEVIGYTFRMVPLLFLDYPQETEVANLRTEKRYPVNIPIIFKVTRLPQPAEPQFVGEAPPSPKASVKALVVDISEGGFLMACPIALTPDTLVEAGFFLPKEDPLNGIKAAVRTCRGKPGGYFIGLAYNPGASPPQVLARLNDLITDIENIPLRL
jgi:c-di-GMP-binding flagellar brake protein YcgR